MDLGSGQGPPQGPGQGLTRFSFQLMDHRRTITELHYLTDIPLPTLSMYVNGHRGISAYHRPILAIALDVPISSIVGYCDKEVIVMSTPDPDPDPDPEPTPEPPEEPSHPHAS